MSRLFGARSVGAVSVVEAPVSQVYARKARIAFFAVACGVGAVSALVASVFMHLALAALFGALVGAVCGFVAGAVIRAWPVLRVLWHWSAEITGCLLLVGVPSLLAREAPPVLALAVVVVPLVVVAAVGRWRRRVRAWWRCAVVRHRLRVCFAEVVRTAGRSQVGRVPLILLARPTPAGERVWVWLRAGLDLAELEGKTGKLAVACWVGEVRVVRASARYAALVRIDVTRRDPLTGKVVSPLAAYFSDPDDGSGSAVPVSPGMPPLGLDLDDVPDVPLPRQGGRGSGR